MLSPLFSDHAVMQRGVPIPLAGIAAPGARVVATFRAAKVEALADDAGRWTLALPAQQAGGPDNLDLHLGDATVVYRDLLVGDVWLCSGQSNMDMSLARIDGCDAELARAVNPKLRLLKVPRISSETPRETIDARWLLSDAVSAGDFSAVGFVFGQRVQQASGIPIGLVQAAVGETPCETWLSREALENDGSFAGLFDRVKKSRAVFPDPEQTYRKAFAQWDHDADLFEREGRPIPGAHPRLIGPNDKWNPGACFNGMIAPLLNTPIAGVIWYQGAGAPDRAFQYRRLFQLLIQDWRRRWRHPALPFYFVQEARFGPRRDQPCEHSWGELREAQAMALALPHTAMAVAIDTGDATDPHPKEKIPLGERLALHARALVYGEKIAHQPPMLEHVVVEHGALRLIFTHTHGGLRTSDGAVPRGFSVSAGASDFSRGHRGFEWARARIDGDSIVLQSETIARPIAARYAWAQNPDCNVTNGAGIPLAPFRTDDWPGVTLGNE